jgi:hypothetical protein
MDSKIARHHDYNDDYADDIKDHILTLAPEGRFYYREQRGSHNIVSFICNYLYP